MPDIVQEIGAYAGLAAVAGLAVLSALYFSQARDVKRLREWAGRAPERSETGAAVPGRAAPVAAPAQAAPRPTAPPVPAATPAKPPVPAQAAATGAQPAAATPAAVRQTQPVAAGAAAASAGNAGAANAAPAAEGKAATPAAAKTEAEPAAKAEAEPAAKTEAEPAAKSEAEPAAKADAAPASPAGAKPAAPAAPTPAATRPGGPATPAAQLPAAASPPRPTPVPPRPPAARPLPQATQVIPPVRRQPWHRRVAGRYVVVAIAGVLILGGAAAFGVSQLASDDGGSAPAERAGQSSGDAETPQGEGENRPEGAAVRPADVTVAVLNGTTVPGLAATLMDQVTAAGFNEGTIANFAPNQQLGESIVQYSSGHERDARAVSRRLRIPQREAATPESRELAGDATVIVIAGGDQAP